VLTAVAVTACPHDQQFFFPPGSFTVSGDKFWNRDNNDESVAPLASARSLLTRNLLITDLPIALTVNALTVNALTVNALTVNALTVNALTVNALTVNGPKCSTAPNVN
jgi:hypothetical protein